MMVLTATVMGLSFLLLFVVMLGVLYLQLANKLFHAHISLLQEQNDHLHDISQQLIAFNQRQHAHAVKRSPPCP